MSDRTAPRPTEALDADPLVAPSAVLVMVAYGTSEPVQDSVTVDALSVVLPSSNAGTASTRTHDPTLSGMLRAQFSVAAKIRCTTPLAKVVVDGGALSRYVADPSSNMTMQHKLSSGSRHF